MCWVLLGAQEPQRFTANVSTVRVDVIVTDERGEFVEDLRPEDFSLFEDDVPQEILGVQLVDVAGRRVQRFETSEAAQGAPVAESGGAASSDLGAVIMLIDVPGLYLQNKIRFEYALTNVLRRARSMSVPHAVYLIDAAGRLRPLQHLTTDVDALERAAGEAGKVPAVQLLNEDMLYEGALDNGDMWSAKTRWARYEERRRTTYTYQLLHDFVDSLAHRSGRTALVWVSTGVDIAIKDRVERPYRITDEESPILLDPYASYSPDSEIRRLQEELHTAANSANVSIYTVDPAAMSDFYLDDVGNLKDRIGSVQDARGDSLRHAAAATGGEAFIGWTDLERVIETIERDTSRFYLLSYAPPAGTGSGTYHEIRVEVDRPDIEVRARPGYIRYSDTERRSRILRGALDLPGTVSGLAIAVQAIRARGPGGEPLLVVDTFLSIDGAKGAAAYSMDPRLLLVYGTVRDDNSELVADIEHEHFSQKIAGGPGAQMLSAAAGDYWMHRAVHSLEAGTHTVRVAAIDPVSERVGVAGLDIEIGDATAGWDVSDPWLAVHRRDGSRSPLVGGRVESGDIVVAYFEVYDGVSPTVGGRVRPLSLLDEAGALSARDDRAPSDERGPAVELVEAEGVHRGWVPLRGLPPGEYVLELDVDDLGAGRGRTMRLPLAVVEAGGRRP